MRGLRRSFLLVLALATPAASHAGEAAGSWQSEWEKTIKAAIQEKRIVTYGSADFQRLFGEFNRKYPEIKAVFVSGSARDNARRLLAERRAGKYLADLLADGRRRPAVQQRTEGVK